MSLKEYHRQTWARHRLREPFSPSLFSRVGGLVRRHGLDETFVRLLLGMDERRADALARAPAHRPKALYRPPLFFLATPEEFVVIQAILRHSASPYLNYAHSPEELLLAGVLYGRAPELDPEALAATHFATLYLRTRPPVPGRAG